MLLLILLLQGPLNDVGMGRLCCLKVPLQLMTVVDLVKEHLNLKNVRLALARHKNMGEAHSLSLYMNMLLKYSVCSKDACTRCNCLQSQTML
jgi:hypothetical protein